MADDINPDDIPFLMDRSVKLVDPDGKQTTAFQDWFQSLWSWMKRSVVDLQTKITTVSAEIDVVAASVVSEQNARIAADEALAEDITTVSASVDDATANGQIYFAAKAAPGGSAAAYGLHLTAGSSYAGFEALALSGGGSAIGFTANQFRFVDSGTSKTVWAYSGGKFVFTGDVSINGSLVIDGTVSEDQLALYSATRRSSAFWTSTYEAQGWNTHSFTATAGSTVLVMAAASSGDPGVLPVFRAMGFSDEVSVPLNESALVIRGYVVSTTGTHSVEMIAHGSTLVGTADLFVNVIVIQR